MSAAALLTPPISDRDAEAMLGGSQNIPATASSMSAAMQGHIAYQEMFPTIATLAMQNHLKELVSLAEEGDLDVGSEGNFDEARLLLIAPLVLSYMILDNLPPARLALSRLSDHLNSLPLSSALLRLVAAARYRNYSLVYKSAGELVDVVQSPGFFDTSLAAVIKVLTDRFLESFRQKALILLTKAYTSITLLQTQVYLGLKAELVLAVAQNAGWSYDQTKQILTPPTVPPRSHVPTLSFARGSSLKTFDAVVDSVSQLDH